MTDYGYSKARENSWTEIEEFPGYYVNALGQIKNQHDRLMKYSKTQYGDLTVTFRKDNKNYTRAVKVIVADVFVAGKTEDFNTPLQLDNDRSNVHAKNLVWRPRWFCWRYSSYMNNPNVVRQSSLSGPVQDRQSKIVYPNVIEAAKTLGILPNEIEKSLVNRIYVWPIWHMFDHYYEEED